MAIRQQKLSHPFVAQIPSHNHPRSVIRGRQEPDPAPPVGEEGEAGVRHAKRRSRSSKGSSSRSRRGFTWGRGPKGEGPQASPFPSQKDDPQIALTG